MSYNDGKPGFAGPPYCACGEYWPTPEHEAECEEQNERLLEFGVSAARLMGAADEDEAARWIVGDRLDSVGLRERVAELEAERNALLERLARRDDEIRRLEARR